MSWAMAGAGGGGGRAKGMEQKVYASQGAKYHWVGGKNKNRETMNQRVRRGETEPVREIILTVTKREGKRLTDRQTHGDGDI